MYDHNVFAVLTAYDQKNKASSAFKLPLNSRWFGEAVGGVAKEPTINSREATPAEDPRSNDDESSVVNRLVVTFNELMKNPLNAIHAGTNPTSSHILLGYRGTKGISARQYNIVVNDDLWIWLHDYYSVHGTAVGWPESIGGAEKGDVDPGTRAWYSESIRGDDETFWQPCR
jgi:hypothetical protein